MSDTQKISFEESIRQLAGIVEALEGGDLPLEKALALFEDGMKLAKTSQLELERAEKRVEELLAVNDDGTATTRPLPTT